MEDMKSKPMIWDPYRNLPIEPLLNKPQLVRKGGKRYLADIIVEIIDSLDYSMYGEPFFGGGRIYFQKQPHFEETINDREERIANFHYCVQHFPDEMAFKQSMLIKDENTFFRIYDKYWGNNPPKKGKKISEPLNDTHLKFRESFTLHQIRDEIHTGYDLLENYEGFDFLDEETRSNIIDMLTTHAIEFYFYADMIFRGSDARTMTYFENDPRTEKNRLRYRIFRPLSWMAERMRRTQSLNKDFRIFFKIVLKYENHTRIFFIDPPYFRVDGYEYPFVWQDYVDLCEILHNLPHTDYFILTLNNLPEFWELFKWCIIELKPTRYTTGGAGQSKDVLEMLITPPWNPKLKTKPKVKKPNLLDSYLKTKDEKITSTLQEKK